MKWGAFYKQSKNLIFLHNRRKLTGRYSKEQWLTLCGFFDGICPRCNKPTEEFTADHIKPLSRGGTNFINNVQPLCLTCNIKKSNLYVIDYRPDFVIQWAEEQMKGIYPNEEN